MGRKVRQGAGLMWKYHVCLSLPCSEAWLRSNLKLSSIDLCSSYLSCSNEHNFSSNDPNTAAQIPQCIPSHCRETHLVSSLRLSVRKANQPNSTRTQLQPMMRQPGSKLCLSLPEDGRQPLDEGLLGGGGQARLALLPQLRQQLLRRYLLALQQRALSLGSRLVSYVGVCEPEGSG